MMLSKEEKLEILYEMYDDLCSLSENVKADALESAIRAYATKLEVKDDFQLTWKMQDLTDKDKEAIKKCIDGATLSAMPSLPNSGKIGYWFKLSNCGNEGYYCSRCHKKVYRIDYSNTMKWKNFQYCPNCGSHNLYMADDPSKIRDCGTCKHYNTERQIQ